MPQDKVETAIFDGIFVCNGHYNTPAVPKYEGIKIYRGQQIHSHDYRCADPFKGQCCAVRPYAPARIKCLTSFREPLKVVHCKKLPFFIYDIFFVYSTGEQVLVIGAGPSGMDLAYEISKKAERVTLSHHHRPSPRTVFPSNVDQKPDIKRLTVDGAEFVDGTTQTYSVIFYCTGKV